MLFHPSTVFLSAKLSKLPKLKKSSTNLSNPLFFPAFFQKTFDQFFELKTSVNT